MELQLKNWGIHTSLSVDIQEVCSITGGQGVGKTSVLAAIMFALYGKDFYGAIGVDRYIQKGKNDATVLLRFDGTDSNPTEIMRVLTKNSSTVYINGAEATQAELNTYLPLVQVALPMLNPFYFMSMNDIEKRELFIKLLPRGDRRDIFVKKYGDKLVDKFLIMTKEKVSKEISNFESYLVKARIELDTKKSQLQEAEEIINSYGDSRKAYSKEQRMELQSRMVALQSELLKMGEIPEIIKQNKEELDGVFAEVKPYLEKYGTATVTQTIALLEKNIEELEADLNHLTNEIGMMSAISLLSSANNDNKCPICEGKFHGSEKIVSANNIKLAMKSNEQAKLVKKIDDMKLLARKLEDYKRVAVSIESKLSDAQRKLDKWTKTNDEFVKVQLEIDEAMNGKFWDTETYNKQVDLKAYYEGRISDLSNQIQNITEQVEDYKVLQEAYSSRGVDAEIIAGQTEKLTQLLTKYVNGISVETTRKNKGNDNTREVFDVFKDGIPYKNVGFGWQLIIASAFSMVLQELTHKKMGMLLLDEASILSSKSLTIIKEWCKKEEIKLIYTKIDDGKIQFSGNE